MQQQLDEMIAAGHNFWKNDPRWAALFSADEQGYLALFDSLRNHPSGK